MSDPNTTAAERVRRLQHYVDASLREKLVAPMVLDLREVLASYAAQAAQAAEIAELREKADRLAEIERAAQADEDDLNKMRDGTKLNRWGLVQIIAYQQEDIAELKKKLTELRAAAQAFDDEREMLMTALDGLLNDFIKAVPSSEPIDCNKFTRYQPALLAYVTARDRKRAVQT